MTLKIKFVDILRATLGFQTGNESWIGVAPDGSSYHIVSPVDSQISKGVMACNCPTDGTPFGGYKGWVYLRIPPFADGLQDREEARRDHAIKVSRELTKNLGRFGIQSLVEWEQSQPQKAETRTDGPFSDQRLSCPSCDKTWNNLIDCFKDPDLIFSTYHPCVSDFAEGYFVFKHKCDGLVYIPVSRFVRKRPEDRNLINLNACPGYCHYKDSVQDCLASCEGSRYRRLARKLLQRGSGPRQNRFHISLTGRN